LEKVRGADAAATAARIIDEALRLVLVIDARQGGSLADAEALRAHLRASPDRTERMLDVIVRAKSAAADAEERRVLEMAQDILNAVLLAPSRIT
jgi:hypothetical protein